MFMPKATDQDAGAVVFERPLSANLMAIDGTWRRSCTVKAVSDNGQSSRLKHRFRDCRLLNFFWFYLQEA